MIRANAVNTGSAATNDLSLVWLGRSQVESLLLMMDLPGMALLPGQKADDGAIISGDCSP